MKSSPMGGMDSNSWRRDLTLLLAGFSLLAGAWIAYQSYLRWLLASGVVAGHEGRVRWAVAHGVRPDDVIAEGKPLLMVAATRGDRRMVELLLDFGANPNRTTLSTASAVAAAVEAGQVPVVGLLIRRGAKLNGIGSSALPLAAVRRDYTMIRILLEAGADPEARSSHGKSAMEIATERGDRRLLELLSQGNRSRE